MSFCHTIFEKFYKQGAHDMTMGSGIMDDANGAFGSLFGERSFLLEP